MKSKIMEIINMRRLFGLFFILFIFSVPSVMAQVTPGTICRLATTLDGK